MNTEYEVRILDIDVKEIKSKLDKLAKFEWDHIQKRYVYDFIPKQDNKWIRLRTNGSKSTLTIKNLVTSEIDGTQELEIRVDDFDRRIQYTLNGVEIDIDYWPLIPTYLEIEGPSEEDVYNTLELLGIDKKDSTTRDVEGIYLDYGYSIKEIYDLKLEEERK